MTFKANAYWKEGTLGVVEGDPTAKAIDFCTPVEFGGVSGAWSPEHLLLAAVASCFVNTFQAIAKLRSSNRCRLELLSKAS